MALSYVLKIKKNNTFNIVTKLAFFLGGLSEQQDPPHLQDDEVVQVETLETKDGDIDAKEELESQPLENSGAEENETSPPIEGTAFDASGHNETSEANVTAQSKDQDPSNNTTEATAGGKRYVMFIGSIHLNSFQFPIFGI